MLLQRCSPLCSYTFTVLQVGHALAVAALDMCQVNPWSRLPTGEYGCLAGVRQEVMLRIRSSRAKRCVCVCVCMLWDTSSVDTHKYPTSYRSLLPSEPQAPPTELKAETKTTVRSFAMQTSKSWEMFLPTARGSGTVATRFELC